jgi:hypothetical protein
MTPALFVHGYSCGKLDTLRTANGVRLGDLELAYKGSENDVLGIHKG